VALLQLGPTHAHSATARDKPRSPITENQIDLTEGADVADARCPGFQALRSLLLQQQDAQSSCSAVGGQPET
jgi:hypothetical protein